MTINQYQRLAKMIANKIIALDGDPNKVYHLNATNSIEITARNPHKKGETSISSGDYNAIISFNQLSNPNNPNYKFRTLKAGSISAYDSVCKVNVDLTNYHFDSSQFKNLIDAINDNGWMIS